MTSIRGTRYSSNSAHCWIILWSVQKNGQFRSTHSWTPSSSSSFQRVNVSYNNDNYLQEGNQCPIFFNSFQFQSNLSGRTFCSLSLWKLKLWRNQLPLKIINWGFFKYIETVLRVCFKLSIYQIQPTSLLLGVFRYIFEQFWENVFSFQYLQFHLLLLGNVVWILKIPKNDWMYYEAEAFKMPKIRKLPYIKATGYNGLIDKLFWEQL